MMPQAQCPQCAAPLPPGATQCAYCGFVTPWGATYAAVQQRAASIQADQAKKARAEKAESTARTGMILALVGLPICCAPLSLVGGVLGFRGARLAKAEGMPRPVTSLVAMIVAAVSLVSSTAVIVMFERDQKAKEDRLAEVRARLQGKRTAVAIDAKVACDVVEEHLAARGFGDKTLGLDAVHCDGAFTANDRRASLADVRFSFNGTDHSTVTACLERRSRWFVLELRTTGSCADLPPPSPFTAPSRQLSEKEITADEEKARAELKSAATAASVKAFTDGLAKIKEHAATAPGAEHVCSRAEMAGYVTGDQRRKVLTVDLDFLDASRSGAGAKDWPFLTSAPVREALDPSRRPEDRAKSVAEVRAAGGPLLVVYKAEKKSWPVVTSKANAADKDFRYRGGEYDGWLYVYDVDTAERKCATGLEFESSDEVSFRKSRFASEKKGRAAAVEADFRDRFESAATDAIRKAAPDLRLGYKVVE